MDRHFKEELCFNCHKKGHKSAECRQKKIHKIETAIEDPKVPSAEVKKLVTSIDIHEFLPEEKDLLNEGFQLGDQSQHMHPPLSPSEV
ncbi:hypothetical protein QCA50_001344 [Cerrena zonata]|uniref:CCHC-type domain-containing protein n=1 Tax=Cerrena zonata TaxID=2478898 RepID=A0AAW0GX18_9APHY